MSTKHTSQCDRRRGTPAPIRWDPPFVYKEKISINDQTCLLWEHFHAQKRCCWFQLHCCYSSVHQLLLHLYCSPRHPKRSVMCYFTFETIDPSSTPKEPIIIPIQSSVSYLNLPDSLIHQHQIGWCLLPTQQSLYHTNSLQNARY